MQCLTADVQRQVLAVHHALDKAEIIRQQVAAFLHDHHAGGVQREALLILLGVEVVGGLAGDEQQRGVGGGALGAGGDDPQRVLPVVEFVFVELVVVLVLDLALGAFPDGHHAVQRFQLGVGLPLRLVIVTGVLRFRFLAGFFAVHRDGVVDVVAVFFHQIRKLVIVQILAELILVGVVLHHHDDVGSHLVLVGLREGVAFHACAFPLPGLLLALSARNDGDLLRHHERGIEAHAELADNVNVVALVLGLEIQRAGLGDGAQILFQLVLGHADAVVRHGKGAAVLVHRQMDLQILLVDADGGVGQALEIPLVAGVGGVGDQLAQKDLPVGVNGIDHQVQQLFALGLELMHCHDRIPLFVGWFSTRVLKVLNVV